MDATLGGVTALITSLLIMILFAYLVAAFEPFLEEFEFNQ